MKDDGGSAFPAGYAITTPEEQGMSLRDWFAGQSLAGIVSAGREVLVEIGEMADKNNEEPENVMASMAYANADAMLAERAKREADGR